MIWKLIKILIFIAILGGLGVIAYAFVGPVLFPADFAAPQPPVGETITLSPGG